MSLLKSDSTTSGRSAIQDASTLTVKEMVQVSASGLKKLRSKFIKRNKGKGKEKAYDTTLAAEATTESASLEEVAIVDGTSPGHETPRQLIAEENLVATEVQVISIQDRDTSANEQIPPLSEATLRQRIQSRLLILPSSCMSSLLPMNMPSNLSIHEDSKPFALLAPTSAMSDPLAKGRDSVLAMLDRIVSTKGKGGKVINECPEGIHEDDLGVEVSSIMISSPLQPTEETEVELARSEIVSINLDNGKDGDASVSQETATDKRFGTWPFTKKKKPKVMKEVRVWYPSRTKVSLQACWWGYRIYLPPPVMLILSDKSLEAAKRAAMIAAALTWLVSHIPTAMLPPQVRPLVMVAKEIVPIFSYVGGFIAWSWSTVQGFDKGDGVILSATWLLPVALLPGTWFLTESPWENPSSMT